MYRSTDLHPFITTLVAKFAPTGAQFGNALTMGAVPPGRIYTDLALLSTVLEDLIRNAFSHSPTTAEISVLEVPAALQFRIADRGPAELEDRIPGCLDFSREAIAELGGSLWLEANPPQGAIVCFVVPTGN
jgi:signal transduction histidine kinase